MGGNTPESPVLLAWARDLLAGILQQARFSSLYKTSPQDDADQADFWNAVVCGDWGDSSDGLLKLLQGWESQAGRVRNVHRPKGPRNLDLDLLLVGSEISNKPHLTLPHPRMDRRAFVLIPLLELAPLGNDPRTGFLWKKCLDDLPEQGVAFSRSNW